MRRLSSYQEGQNLLLKSKLCAECGGQLLLAWGGAFGVQGYVLRCSNSIDHDGIAREAKLSTMDTPDEYNIGNLSRIRRRDLVQRFGGEKGTALAKYAGTTSLTTVTAREVIVTIWPKAPEIEVVKAAMVCQQYGLNPLMKHLYLVPFKTKVDDGGGRYHYEETYSMVLGIKASRIIARRRGEYAYIDDTPRIMTEAEQVKIFGEVDIYNICAITRLQDRKGNSAIGTGKWPKDKEVKGADKGNTKLNMAMIRSERQALERLFPDSMPGDVPDVIDERYQDLTDDDKVDTSTGEIIEQPTDESALAPEPSEGEYAEASPEPPPSPIPEPVMPAKQYKPASEIKTIGDLYKACITQWPEMFATKDDVLRVVGVKDQTDITQKPSDIYTRILSMRTRK